MFSSGYLSSYVNVLKRRLTEIVVFRVDFPYQQRLQLRFRLLDSNCVASLLNWVSLIRSANIRLNNWTARTNPPTPVKFCRIPVALM